MTNHSLDSAQAKSTLKSKCSKMTLWSNQSLVFSCHHVTELTKTIQDLVVATIHLNYSKQQVKITMDFLTFRCMKIIATNSAKGLQFKIHYQITSHRFATCSKTILVWEVISYRQSMHRSLRLACSTPKSTSEFNSDI